MKKLILFLTIILLFSSIVFATITGSETMTRTLPSQANPGQSFTVTYNAIGTSGNYGVSVVDAVSGGCTPSNIQFVLTSPATTYQVTFTAPSSSTNACTFTGDYKYGTSAIRTFTTQTITFCTPICTRPSDLCATSSSNGCSGTCTWSVTKNSLAPNADINCDNVIDRNELGTYITKWTNNQITRDELGNAIQSWSSQ